MSNVVKSVFRQREVEKIYKIKTRKIFTFKEEEMEIEIAEDNENYILSDTAIASYDIDMPMLEVGEKFHLSDIGKTVKIKNRMRSSDGSIVYYVEDNLVETERTKKSYEYCANKILEHNIYKEQYEELKEKFDKYKEKFDKYKNEYKYKCKYFNFD